jgi:hypothetical protein
MHGYIHHLHTADDIFSPNCGLQLTSRQVPILAKFTNIDLHIIVIINIYVFHILYTYLLLFPNIFLVAQLFTSNLSQFF